MNSAYIVPICFNFIQWVRDNIFQPLIEVIAKIFVAIFIDFFSIIINEILTALVGLIYLFYIAILKIIDLLQDIFDALSGCNEIYYMTDGVRGQGYLTEVLLKMPEITGAFRKIWFLSVLLCGIFLIAAVIRSISHLDDKGQSINEVLKSAANTFVMFVLVQFIAFGTLSLSNVVLNTSQKAMNYAVGDDADLRLSNAIFAMTSINAGRTGDKKKDEANVLYQLVGQSGYDPDWSKVEPFYKGERKYYDLEDVSKDLLITKIDYISGFIAIVFILKYMAGSVIVFVQRVILVVVGFITAPFFVAITPLDGGERFKRWQEFFIGTCLSSLGVIISVKVYFMIIPIFISDGLIYSGTGILSYMIRLYTVVMLSIAFEKTGAVFNRILADAHIISSEEGFGMIMSFRDDFKDLKGKNDGDAKKSSSKNDGDAKESSKEKE